MSHTGTSQTWLCTQMPWDLVKVQMLIQEAPGGLGSAFLTRSQGMPMLLVCGPHSEKHRPICPPKEGQKNVALMAKAFSSLRAYPWDWELPKTGDQSAVPSLTLHGAQAKALLTVLPTL